MDVDCAYVQICSHFLLFNYAFYYHNASQRLKTCQTWWLNTCQNLSKEPCFETLIKSSQSQVMVISQSHETLNKTWVTAISSKSFFLWMLTMLHVVYTSEKHRTQFNDILFCSGFNTKIDCTSEKSTQRRQTTKRNTTPQKNKRMTERLQALLFGLPF